MKNKYNFLIVITCLMLAGTTVTPVMAAHFIPVWNGNPYNPMTICVTEAKISTVSMVAGDEVGVFDGVNCVGRGILLQSINPLNSATYLYISCSKDDPGTPAVDGFTEGHTVVYKLWKQSTNIETEYVTHTFPYSPSFAFETFTQNETSVVSLSAVNVPAIRLLQDITVASGQVTCYDATQAITVAGSGTLFQVSAGGNVTMIAGQTISYLPGTAVLSGGYLRGYISTNGLYCGGLPPIAPLADVEILKPNRPDEILLRVFPNPTTGRFSVNAITGRLDKPLSIEILSSTGEQILRKGQFINDNADFDMSSLPPGIYLILVSSNEHNAMVKLLKY